MSELRAAHRYAQALLGFAASTGTIEAVSRDCAFIETLLGASREFLLFLRSPVITTQKKKTVLEAILREKVGGTTLKFVLLLARKNREGLLPDIIGQFYRLRDEKMGVLNAVARTVIPLGKDQEERLLCALRDLTKKNVRLSCEQDASLIGGFTVRYQDTVLDASVKHQLELLRERFATGVGGD